MTVDSILFAVFGYLTSFDYQQLTMARKRSSEPNLSEELRVDYVKRMKGVRAFLRADFTILALLVTSLVLSIYSVVTSDVFLSPSTLGLPLFAAFLALGSIIARFLDMSFLQ